MFHAPGRVNLIGEHTDYNDGFVLPAAIQLGTCALASRADSHKLAVHSVDLDETDAIDVENPPERGRGRWSDYVFGVAVLLARSGHRVAGSNLLIKSAVPLGSGLSSSAALEVAAALAILSVSDSHVGMSDLAKLCQKAENEFVGARVGIMDQLASCLGKRDHAMMIDCRSLAVRYVPVPKDASMVVCNTMVRHSNASGEYNQRREECEQAVATLAHCFTGVRSLRDISYEQLKQCEDRMDPVHFVRARHVVTENDRVRSAAGALEIGDTALCGRLMNESHRSLRDDYEVSCRELDIAAETAIEQPGVFGSRMMGGGFGGCIISLVERSRVDQFTNSFQAAYRHRAGLDAEVYVCTAEDGAREETA